MNHTALIRLSLPGNLRQHMQLYRDKKCLRLIPATKVKTQKISADKGE